MVFELLINFETSVRIEGHHMTPYSRGHMACREKETSLAKAQVLVTPLLICKNVLGGFFFSLLYSIGIKLYIEIHSYYPFLWCYD